LHDQNDRSKSQIGATHFRIVNEFVGGAAMNDATGFAKAELGGIAKAAGANKRADKLDIFDMVLSFTLRLCFFELG